MTGVEPAYIGFAIRGLTFRATCPFYQLFTSSHPITRRNWSLGVVSLAVSHTQEAVTIIYVLLQFVNIDC